MDSGLKDIYVPSKVKYKKAEKQIRQVAQIKITDVTYDIILNHVDAPNNAKLPEIMQVKAENKVDLPKIEGYNAKVFDENDKEVKEITADKNMILTVRWEVEDIEKDSDGDGLSDYIEDLLKTDKNSKDSDKDGLNDGFEFKYLDTDLLKKDTDGNGVSDADEDFDKDGLSNIKEQEVGTNPASVDSDGDNLTDYEEVTKYHTNPLTIDSDKDEIYDDDEIKLGLDPNNPMTDGVTLDAKRMFEQTADDSIKDKDLLDSDNWLVPSISGNVYDNISKNTRMENSPYSSFKDNRAVLSNTVKIRTSYDIPLNLTFSYKNQYNGDSKNLTIVSFIDNELELVNTVVNEGTKTISGQIQGDGEYFVIDLDEFLKSFGIDVLSNIKQVNNTTQNMLEIVNNKLTETQSMTSNMVTTPTALFLKSTVNVTTTNMLSLVSKNNNKVGTGKADIVFVLDNMWHMGGTNAKNNIRLFAQRLVNEYNIDANFSLIEYRDVDMDGKGTIIQHTSNASPWFTNVEFFKEEIDNLEIAGGQVEQSLLEGLEMARDLNYRTDASRNVVVITDRIFNMNNSSAIEEMNSIAGRFAQDDISVSIISTVPTDPVPNPDDHDQGSSSPEESPPEAFRILVEGTDGLFGYANDGVDKFFLKLADKIGKKTNSGDWVILDDYSTVKLSKKLSEIDHNDTDRDGLTDAQELGESVEKNMDEYINLLLKKHSIPTELYKGKRSITVWNNNSNPTELDTDFDGLPDGNMRYSELLENDKKSSPNIGYNTVSSYSLRNAEYKSLNAKKEPKSIINLDVSPIMNKYEATAYWKGDQKTRDNAVTFEIDYRKFFDNSNMIYYKDLAVLSSICAFDTYSYNPEKKEEKGKDMSYLNVKSMEHAISKKNNLPVKTSKSEQFSTYVGDNSKKPSILLEKLGLEDISNIKLNGYTQDPDDITEILIGHLKLRYKGKDRNMIVLVVRGTNGTNSEWTSNFDVGAATTQYTSLTGNHRDWTNKENHKGFDVTANRVIAAVENYLNTYSLNEGSILITGHSRGAAVANLVGKYFEDKKTLKSFTYAFATPNTTTSANAGNYQTIFNIVNEDDMVPYMPLQKWGFKKYGRVDSISVHQKYERKLFEPLRKGTFEWFIEKDYNNNGKKKGTLEMLGHIAKNREELYIFDKTIEGRATTGDFGDITKAREGLKVLKKELEEEKLLRFSKFDIVKVHGTLTWHYAIEVRYCPAFLTQTLANMASKKGRKIGRDLSGKYEDAKWSFIFSSGEAPLDAIHVGGMYHPHMPLTYYLIARNDFKQLK